MSVEAAYHPRSPEENPLYGVVSGHLETFLARQREQDRHVPGLHLHALVFDGVYAAREAPALERAASNDEDNKPQFQRFMRATGSDWNGWFAIAPGHPWPWSALRPLLTGDCCIASSVLLGMEPHMWFSGR